MNRNIKINLGGNGINFFELLAIVFIVLRLCGVIDWPWIWVLSPLWIGIAIIGIIIGIVAIVMALRG